MADPLHSTDYRWIQSITVLSTVSYGTNYRRVEHIIVLPCMSNYRDNRIIHFRQIISQISHGLPDLTHPAYHQNVIKSTRKFSTCSI